MVIELIQSLYACVLTRYQPDRCAPHPSLETTLIPSRQLRQLEETGKAHMPAAGVWEALGLMQLLASLKSKYPVAHWTKAVFAYYVMQKAAW